LALFKWQEVGQEIEIASLRVKTAVRREAENLQRFDAVLPAKRLQFGPPLVDELGHRCPRGGFYLIAGKSATQRNWPAKRGFVILGGRGSVRAGKNIGSPGDSPSRIAQGHSVFVPPLERGLVATVDRRQRMEDVGCKMAIVHALHASVD